MKISIKLCDMATRLGFTFFGDGEQKIFSLKYAHEADKNSLAIAYNEKDILRTAAQSVLTEPRLLPVKKILFTAALTNLMWRL